MNNNTSSSKLVCVNNSYYHKVLCSVEYDRHKHNKNSIDFKTFIRPANVQSKTKAASAVVTQGKMLHFGAEAAVLAES